MIHTKNFQNKEMNEVIKEVRQIRHEISAEFGHDPHKFGEYCRELEKELRKSGRYKFVKSAKDRSETPESDGANITG